VSPGIVRSPVRPHIVDTPALTGGLGRVISEEVLGKATRDEHLKATNYLVKKSAPQEKSSTSTIKSRRKERRRDARVTPVSPQYKNAKPTETTATSLTAAGATTAWKDVAVESPTSRRTPARCR